jgi:MoaA/NifB/PqqE/SkfB family radical SAM enzyme
MSYAVVALDMLRKKHRNRISPLRSDQIEMLRCRDPEKEGATSVSPKSGGLEPTNSKTFCVLPFIHSYFATDGHASLCVISPDPLLGGPEGGGLNVSRHSLPDIFHSPAMDDARRQLLEGKELKACTVCYDAERLGAESHRLRFNTYWQRRRPDLMARIRERQEKAAFDKPLSADFRFGNLCNLRCQICNPHNSSQIERDAVLSKWRDAKYVRMKGRYQGEWYDAPELADEVGEFSSDIEFINLGGGEPSISKGVQKWFSRLIDSGQAAKIELRVQTNLTNVNPKFLDLVSQFGQPRIYLSIDGFGPLNDYLRYPSKWRIIERNADYLGELAKRSRMSICLTPAIGAYNALSIVHLFEWAASRGFDILANHVRNVDALDCALIPDEARALAVQRMRDFLSSVTNPMPHQSTIEDLCRYLEAPVDLAYAKACREQFHAFTREIDQDRGMRFEDYSPEMARFLGYSSGL